MTPAPPPETERRVQEIGAILTEDSLPDAYAEAMPNQMCSHSHRVPLQWATSEHLRGVIAALVKRKKRMEKRGVKEASGG